MVYGTGCSKNEEVADDSLKNVEASAYSSQEETTPKTR